MIKRIAVTVLIASSAVFAQTEKPKNVYKTFKLSTSEMIFTCQNGADPTTKRLADSTIVVSCGATLKAKWDKESYKFTCPNGMYVWPDDSQPEDKGSAYCGVYPLNK